MERKKVRIVSNGTSAGTEIFDENGQRMQSVAAVTIYIGADDLAYATVTFEAVEVDVTVDDGP